jgi:DNA-binding transcriptional ArsR family regulator
LVHAVQEPGYIRYFPALTRPAWTPRHLHVVCLLRRPVAFQIVLALLDAADHGTSLGRTELAARLGLARASISHHLDLLAAAEAITVLHEPKATRSARKLYALQDPAWIRGVLASFTPLPDELDAFTRLWGELLAGT